MSRFITVAAMVVAACWACPAAYAGQHHKPQPRPANVRVAAPDAAPAPAAADPRDAIEWLTDFDQAAKTAADEGRPLLVLINSEAAERASIICRFTSRATCRAVRGSKAVPVKLLPPPAMDGSGLSAEEAKKRQEVLDRSKAKYEELAKRFGVRSVPSLVLAAPDAAKLNMMIAPDDDQILAALARLPDMLKAHQEAVGGGKKPEAGEAPKPAEPAKPAKPKPAGEDDF